mmetsp:Transcript_18267/g.25584  ORF Transcript_18267/g.25584 Transcript_18267/m.25584 type:complete len:152 (+) Transcript_18267:36-491(+)
MASQQDLSKADNATKLNTIVQAAKQAVADAIKLNNAVIASNISDVAFQDTADKCSESSQNFVRIVKECTLHWGGPSTELSQLNDKIARTAVLVQRSMTKFQNTAIDVRSRNAANNFKISEQDEQNLAQTKTLLAKEIQNITGWANQLYTSQ